ncbi:MAG: ROK family protein [Candidatus Baldrarchaeia archaeon]
MGNMKNALAIDVGGTYLKSAIITSHGTLLKNTFRRVPINSQGTAEEIIQTFVNVINSALNKAKSLEVDIAGIGIGMPGPFDYKKGISWMKHKFSSIYGLNLKTELISRLNLKKTLPIQFENDAWVFLRGETWRGAARGYNRIVGLTIGTGLGSAFMVGDEIVTKGPGIPADAWIGGLPYGDGIVEDRVSRRGIIARYRELVGNTYSGEDVKEIALKGLKNGDKNSLKVFREIGIILAEVLTPILSDFRAECLVFGGQISKSFSLFENPLKQLLKKVPTLKKITRARFIDLSPLYGAAKLVFSS